MRKSLVLAGVVLVLVAAPVAVFAASGLTSGNLDRQFAKWTNSTASTSSTAWHDVPGLSRLSACTQHQVTAILSVTVRGAPVRFRVYFDTPEAPMRPGNARFVPGADEETFSSTFVKNSFPFEADDTHVFSVQWRSPTGRPVTMTRGVLDLLFERGTQGCP
jgi:hypothetical protein